MVLGVRLVLGPSSLGALESSGPFDAAHTSPYISPALLRSIECVYSRMGHWDNRHIEGV